MFVDFVGYPYTNKFTSPVNVLNCLKPNELLEKFCPYVPNKILLIHEHLPYKLLIIWFQSFRAMIWWTWHAESAMILLLQMHNQQESAPFMPFIPIFLAIEHRSVDTESISNTFLKLSIVFAKETNDWLCDLITQNRKQIKYIIFNLERNFECCVFF